MDAQQGSVIPFLRIICSYDIVSVEKNILIFGNNNGYRKLPFTP